MPVTTSTEAGRVVAASAQARRQQEAADARRAAREALDESAARRGTYDRATPHISAESAAQDDSPLFVGKAPLATVPEPPTAAAPVTPKAEAKAARKFSLATTVAYRGREITITAEGMTLDEFCDLMDSRKYPAPAPLALAAPIATADDLPDGFKLCQKHRAPMRPRNKQNDTWHSHNVGTAESPLWCKGYRGSDSPGYEVD